MCLKTILCIDCSWSVGILLQEHLFQRTFVLAIHSAYSASSVELLKSDHVVCMLYSKTSYNLEIFLNMKQNSINSWNNVLLKCLILSNFTYIFDGRPLFSCLIVRYLLSRFSTVYSSYYCWITRQYSISLSVSCFKTYQKNVLQHCFRQSLSRCYWLEN